MRIAVFWIIARVPEEGAFAGFGRAKHEKVAAVVGFGFVGEAVVAAEVEFADLPSQLDVLFLVALLLVLTVQVHQLYRRPS